MSQAKLAAAKELIQEKRYTEARMLLKTVNNPIAVRWLQQLDSIAPESLYHPPDSNIIPSPPQYYAPPLPITDEAARYYHAENRKRKRRRIGNGLELVFMGICCFVTALYLASLPKYTISGSPPPDDSLSVLLLVGGIVLTFAGIFIIRRREE